MKGGETYGIKLSAYHARMMRAYRKVIEAAGIDPELIYRAEAADPYAVPHMIRSMTDQIVRGEVIQNHALIDWYLDRQIASMLWGARKKWPTRESKRARALASILRDQGFMRKLTLVRKFQKIPKGVIKAIEEITSVRNALAHSFFVESLPYSRRTYKGKSIRSAAGLLAFEEDATLVRDFFMPQLREFSIFD